MNFESALDVSSELVTQIPGKIINLSLIIYYFH